MFQFPQTNPGLNNTPFKFTKYSNAYMLVYIRWADKDKVICNVDEKDIAEHLQVAVYCDTQIFFQISSSKSVKLQVQFCNLVLGTTVLRQGMSYLLRGYKAVCTRTRPELKDHMGEVFFWQIRLKKEQEEKERRRKEKAEAHLYTIIKV
jgi:hypothetical protein